MTGKINAGDFNLAASCCVDIYQGQCDRQSAFAVDDRHQVGIGHIVVIVGVPLETVCAGDYVLQDLNNDIDGWMTGIGNFDIGQMGDVATGII